jgi:hypothetical protein
MNHNMAARVINFAGKPFWPPSTPFYFTFKKTNDDGQVHSNCSSYNWGLF